MSDEQLVAALIDACLQTGRASGAVFDPMRDEYAAEARRLRDLVIRRLAAARLSEAGKEAT